MGFVSKQISKDEAQSLMKKYKISIPWPGGDESTEVGLTMCVYDSNRDAFFARARVPFGMAIEGYRNFDGLDGIGVLIWKDTAVRVDYYEDVVNDYKKIYLVATRIVALERMKLYESEIESLLKEALPAICKSNLPPANKNLEFVFRSIPMEFSDNEEDIWKQRRV